MDENQKKMEEKIAPKKPFSTISSVGNWMKHELTDEKIEAMIDSLDLPINTRTPKGTETLLLSAISRIPLVSTDVKLFVFVLTAIIKMGTLKVKEEGQYKILAKALNMKPYEVMLLKEKAMDYAKNYFELHNYGTFGDVYSGNKDIKIIV